MSDWDDATTKIIELGGGCRLATRHLLISGIIGAAALSDCKVLKGVNKTQLVKKGTSAATAAGRAVLLRLTGQRGRPAERIVLPPPPKSKASVVVGPCRTPTRDKLEMGSRTPMHGNDWANQITHLQSRLTKALQMIAELERRIHMVQADQSDLTEVVAKQGSVIEGLRQAWRTEQGYQPQHAELPSCAPRLSALSTGAQL